MVRCGTAVPLENFSGLNPQTDSENQHGLLNVHVNLGQKPHTSAGGRRPQAGKRRRHILQAREGLDF